jgi:asparagine N-glycosylation enzyme membrane subunit Stt3
MEEKKVNTRDISKEIERTTPEPEKIVTKDISEKEEKISRGVAEIPIKEKDDLERRKEKIINFLKKKKDWIYYLILSFIVFIGVYIRTRNIPKLKDITTGAWTLGPDLDPFLFLRWAKYIVEHGKLFLIDPLRYIPLADICSGQSCNPINTAVEMKLLPHMIVGLHKFLNIFSNEVTVTYSAIIFPVVMFGLTTIAFFLFTRKIFYKEKTKTKNIIALISTAFFVLIPSLLPRTIAGIPEKESAAFFFMFMAFYFILEAFTSDKFKRGMIFGVLAGVMTSLMALTWGGVIFIFLTIPIAFLLAFIFGKVKNKEFWIYSIWLFISIASMMLFSARYPLRSIITSISTGVAIGIFIIVGVSLFLMKNDKLKKIRSKIKLPKRIFYLLFSLLILFLFILIFLGPKFIIGQINHVKDSLIHPMVDRFSMTVAENKQPYFATDWRSSFGPIILNIPLFFWLFFTGSVLLFNHLIKELKKRDKRFLTFSYFIFLICLIFSRYSPGSKLNGENALSLIIYFGGWLFFLGSFGYFYYKNYKEGDFHLFKEFNFSYILYFIILTLGIIGARGGIRLIMVLGAISPVTVAFLFFKISRNYFREKDDVKKFFIGVIAIIIIIASIFTLWTYYQQDKYTAENMAPGSYQWQWQEAMGWVRENTPENAVFAHWWDYGYWLQSIGNRATILDGGNAIGYWNHLMGRYVLTGTDERDTLEFLYAHNGTHLLIDSTEIGKYTAFSSIGSDENYDRLSWIPSFSMDEKQTQETSSETIYVYQGGTLTDEDIIWEEGEKEILFPKDEAVVGAIMLK